MPMIRTKNHPTQTPKTTPWWSTGSTNPRADAARNPREIRSWKKPCRSTEILGPRIDEQVVSPRAPPHACARDRRPLRYDIQYMHITLHITLTCIA